MKKITILFAVLVSVISLQAQKTTKTLVHNGLTRSYIEYVPTIYNPATPVPIVICLHGLGDNMSNFTGIGMHQIANTQNFIVLTPQAVSSPFGAAWNSGASYSGYQLNATVDDIGFIGALIDTTMALYNIDPKRVYAMGFSMGGFMCHRLACQMNNRIAAIASVAGTIGTSLTCNPGRAVPVLHLHGTGDSTIYYNNNMYGMDAMEAVMFWVNNNHCDTPAVITDMPDIAADGFTIKHFVFGGGDDSTVVEHYRVDSCDHQWIYPPNNDMSYTQTIWEFLSRYSIPDWVNVAEISSGNNVHFYPNPVKDRLFIENSYAAVKRVFVYNMIGKLVLELPFNATDNSLDVSRLISGIYIIKLQHNDARTSNFKFIKL